MSGGFFRGTSADQDTRFSNKQAKLLKTQKFAPELDHPVNMKKVNLDVMRPWIATRVTELLGFEDEVLINFVNGLLEAGEVDGKKVQIQLTGFMEKNTGKFMKELWSLLLSAQNNVSGVPQQFLDAKEEETRKKKAETDRIVQEIQKRREKEGRGLEQEKHNRKGIEADTSRSGKAAPDSGSKHSLSRTTEEKSDGERRQSSRMKSRHSDSPYSSDHLLVSHRGTSSPDRSSGKSFSKSRSYFQDGVKSRSGSISSKSQRRTASPQRRHYSPLRGHSDSPERSNRSSRRCSISPRRRRSSPNHRSHLRQRSPLLRRRSTSRSRRRSPSPIRWRSPHLRQRSPSPHRRPPSPMRHRSPSLPHHRSLSPRRRRSPVHRKSPSPLRRRSPIRRRSLSPARHRSQTPLRRRSPPRRSPMHRRRSPQPSPKTHAVEVSLRQRNRSRSLDRNQSPSHQTHRCLSGEGDRCVNSVKSGKHQDEHVPEKEGVKRSPDHHFTGQDAGEHPGPGRKVSDSVSCKLPTSLSSSQHDLKLQRDIVPGLTQEKSSNRSTHERNINLMKNRRSLSLSRSPEKQNRKRISHHDSPQTRMEEEKALHAREDAHHRADYSHKRSKHSFVEASRKKFVNSETSLDIYSPDRSAVGLSLIGRVHAVKLESRRKESELRSDMDFPERNQRVSPTSEGKEHGPRMFNVESHSMDDVYDRHCYKRKSARNASSLKEKQSNEQALKSSARDTHSRSEDVEHRESHFHEEYVKKSKHKVDKRNQSNNINTDSEDKEKRRHKKSENHKRGLDGDTEYDSQMDDRKVAKRIRKDAQRQCKEERRRRREERHRRRLERRAGKLEPTSMDTVTPPPDLEKNHNDADGIEGDIAMHGDSYPSDTEETGTEQKKLEIELRKKALESLRVKKAINP